MSESTERHPLALKPLVYRTPGMDAVTVRRDIGYRAGTTGPLTMDLYQPEAPDGQPPPIVVLVTGYADVGVPRPLGCAFKEMAVVVSVARLLAASGLAVVAYTASDPVADARAALGFVANERRRLGVDADRIGIWASSGHVPLALSLLLEPRPAIAAAVLLNGFMFDVDGVVAAAARTYRFANPLVGRAAGDLAADVPLYVVRSGRDEFAGVNVTIDRFVAEALARNLPLTLVNHENAPHAFEINDDSDTSRRVIQGAVAFLRARLPHAVSG